MDSVPLEQPSPDAIHAQVDRLCAHPLFAQATRLKRLLRFTVDETCAGRGDSLKEHTLGVNVFDRGLSYDPATDPSARVYVARLRSKLIEYYATSGREDDVLIEIPKGSYTPVFSRSHARPLSPPATAPVPTPRDASTSGRPLWRRPSWIAAVVAVSILGGIAAYYYSRPGPAPRASVAVLPFINMSSEPDTEYYSDGLSEEIINALSQLSGLRVVARTSTFQFKGKAQDIREIGKRLDVGAVLEGSVRRDGHALRVTAQLIDTTSGYHLWSKTYDRPIEEIFRTQNEIAQSVAQMLRVTLIDSPPRLLVRPPTQSVEAYDLYLKGRFAWNRWTDVGFEKAIFYFEQAIARDGSFASAYAGLANCYSLLALYGVMSSHDAMPKARALAARSLALDDTLSEGHTGVGLVKYLFDWDRDGAERELGRAVELNPGSADAHHFHSHALVLAGRIEDGVAELQKARVLDPLSLVLQSDVGWTSYLTRQTAKAESQLKQTLSLDPDFNETLYDLGITFIQAGRFAEAISTLEKAKSQFASHEILGALGYAYARGGRQRDARELLASLISASRERYISPASLAVINMGLGDADQAFVWLDRGVEARDPFLLLIDVDSIFDSLRSDPRFASLRRRVLFPKI